MIRKADPQPINEDDYNDGCLAIGCLIIIVLFILFWVPLILFSLRWWLG